MLDDRSLDGYMTSGDNRGASESILAGADLMNLRERQDISNADFGEAGHSQKILGSKKIFFASNRGYHILVGLRANKIEGAKSGRIGVKCPTELLAYKWH